MIVNASFLRNTDEGELLHHLQEFTPLLDLLNDEEVEEGSADESVLIFKMPASDIVAFLEIVEEFFLNDLVWANKARYFVAAVHSRI